MANIKDVAKEAGVSVTTVSRVMNDRGYISEKTRKKVYDAMEKIGYHPNELAKNFFRQKTNIIGLILPDISISFYAEETKYIEEHLYKNSMMERVHPEGRRLSYEIADKIEDLKFDGV